MRPVTTALLGAITASVLLAACGADGSSVPAGAIASGERSSSVEPARDAASPDIPGRGPAHRCPGFPEDTSPQTSRSSGGVPLVLTDVRMGAHQGFDRIVLEFSGTGTPGWAVNYVDEATVEGSGDDVTLDGDAILDIHASNTTWPASDYYSGPTRIRDGNGGIAEVYVVGTFEGHTQVLAGVDGSVAPFRVVALAHPSRLVIDVVDAGEPCR